MARVERVERGGGGDGGAGGGGGDAGDGGGGVQECVEESGRAVAVGVGVGVERERGDDYYGGGEEGEKRGEGEVLCGREGLVGVEGRV